MISSADAPATTQPTPAATAAEQPVRDRVELALLMARAHRAADTTDVPHVVVEQVLADEVERLRVELELRTALTHRGASVRDDLAHALAATDHRAAAEYVEAEVGGRACGGDRDERGHCGGCIACVYAQMTWTDHTPEGWARRTAQADALLDDVRRSMAYRRARRGDVDAVDELADRSSGPIARAGRALVAVAQWPGLSTEAGTAALAVLHEAVRAEQATSTATDEHPVATDATGGA